VTSLNTLILKIDGVKVCLLCVWWSVVFFTVFIFILKHWLAISSLLYCQHFYLSLYTSCDAQRSCWFNTTGHYVGQWYTQQIQGLYEYIHMYIYKWWLLCKPSVNGPTNSEDYMPNIGGWPKTQRSTKV